jgi:cytochrome oxidase Cu insertion factor (SCO1/SenC/PrrC family)
MNVFRPVVKQLTASLLALCAVLVTPQTALSEAVVGEQAPTFTAKDSTGKEVSLNTFKGKIVVLEWFNQNCPFVKKFYKQQVKKQIVRIIIFIN